MNNKKVTEGAIRSELHNSVKIQANPSAKLQDSDDWLLYILPQYICVKLELQSQYHVALLKIQISIQSGCEPLDRGQSLFEIEITKKQDPDNFLYRVMRHNKPTIQEAVIANLLDDLQLRYIPQWILPFQERHHVFDFLIEPNMVLECTLTERKAYKVPSWGRERAIVLDRKFQILKSFKFVSFSVILLEATRYPPEKLSPIIRHLGYTDRFITSITEFEAFMGEWKQTRVTHDKEAIPEPTTEVEVPTWVDNDPQSTLERFI